MHHRGALGQAVNVRKQRRMTGTGLHAVFWQMARIWAMPDSAAVSIQAQSIQPAQRTAILDRPQRSSDAPTFQTRADSGVLSGTWSFPNKGRARWTKAAAGRGRASQAKSAPAVASASSSRQGSGQAQRTAHRSSDRGLLGHRDSATGPQMWRPCGKKVQQADISLHAGLRALGGASSGFTFQIVT